MKSQSVTIQMKATQQYFPAMLFIILYKMVLTFEFVGQILKCDHSNESYWAVLSCDAVIILYKVVLTLESLEGILNWDRSSESYWTGNFSVVLFITHAIYGSLFPLFPPYLWQQKF